MKGITVKRAIELLNIAKEGFPVNDAEEYYKAMELGIEALKRIKEYRDDHENITCTWRTLPGETRE